ncbi:DUF1294 domain-containing protein [Oceanisphaera avium]|uniref:Cold-shock protein n=1 Tax=Oceanisphaera avium TaxID=1903694 RepID=A0A1Y0CWC4_9GAMM|nr:DUF1294 domain-containing protein [Oceanisphaera avium]ART79216.1 hypothetical protein CBP12_02860 [Oceanisphaera avium]
MKLSQYFAISYFLAVALLALGYLLENNALCFKVSVAYLLALLLISALTFLVYAKDKRAARLALRRTPECTLHGLAVIGGWPGVLIAQARLRHKTQKTSFKIRLWLSIIGHLAAVGLIIFISDGLGPHS